MEEIQSGHHCIVKQREDFGGAKSMLTDILCAAAVHRLKNCWRILRSCGKQENSQCCCDLHCFGTEEMQKKCTMEFHFLRVEARLALGTEINSALCTSAVNKTYKYQAGWLLG